MKKIIIIIVLLLIVGCSFSEAKVEDTTEAFAFTDGISKYADITKYTIYGRYFNFNALLQGNYPDIKLVLKNNDYEIEYNLLINFQDGQTEVKTNELINEGINLEDIKEGSYFILLKYNDEYYSLKNTTKYEDLDYYTLTKNNKNYEVSISFIKILDKEYFVLNKEEKKLPDDYYDIVIDPGHGGVDIGAKNGKAVESKINLEYSLLLKDKLEKLGLKVKLTREKDDFLDNYGDDGRVSIPYITKAKMLLSIHLNSAVKNVYDGGVEIYVPNHTNINFAKRLAENIVNNTSTIYSKNKSDRIKEGVYLRTLSKSDLETMKKDALEDGYTPYENATTDSTYYYIIRETGGIITGAYIDSRNPKKEANPYYNSNHGCESYLLEMGYISSDKNLNIILNEKEKYVDAIVETVKEEFKME